MTINRRAKRDATKLFRLCRPKGLLDENRARQVVRRITAAGYRESPAILAHLLRLIRLDRQQHTATVESATAMPDDLRAEVAARLTQLYGPGLITEFADRPSLIGGMRVQVGSDVYDGSVLGRLTQMEQTF
jgi:F-type H+-transporting ATPase subunit delta